ncbi:protein PIN-LIKES 3-like isoform X1 [Chenopodium quinoa]|uniref:protein PIN-LIKES 3-like isoform X1 n=1 Tax=Chenopodium quinoa TaxID=63459 RepID=UPI000B793E2E|nr:protein PIN-LIKES 3-like isoform X1 [Chenopodium quinoa]
MRSLFDLFIVASMPILKVLLITALGSILAINRIDILGKTATHHLNKLVFFVFGPALVGSNLAKTVAIKSFLTLWFMVVNILLTFLLGSAMGWVLAKLTKAPKHIKGLILASCSAGNFYNSSHLFTFIYEILVVLASNFTVKPGNLGNTIIILPAMCKEKGSPFGAPDVCERYGLAYASLSMAIGTVYFWLYTYNIVRISSKEATASTSVTDETLVNVQPQEEPPLHSSDNYALEDPPLSHSSKSMVKLSSRIKQCLRIISKEFNLKAVLAPSTIGVMIGFFIGTISPLRKLLMDNTLHVVGDTSFMIGDAAIPCKTLILGANLQRGLRGSGIQVATIMGIVAVRYLFLPLLGALIVKGAVQAGFVQSHDIFFQFVLLLQYTMPPAASISTVTELFKAGQNECSVIMLWTNILAPITLTLWCTFFLWHLA